ncbi:MAG: transglutaminase domain-containing protein [archaeon]
MHSGKIAVLTLLVFLCTGAFSAEIENSTAMQTVRAHVLIEGQGSITGSLNGTEAKIEILSFRDTEYQKIILLEETLEINGKQVRAEPKEDEFGNRYALFKVKSVGSFTYKIDAVIETDAMLPELQDYSLSNKIGEFPEFLKPSENIESNHETIRTMALNTFDSNSLLETIADVTQWTYDNIEYDLNFYPETYSAISTLGTRKGVCDEFAVVAAAMLRAKGIPTRIVTGLTFNPEKHLGWNNHAWLQAYSPNSGWISLDPTFGEAGVVDGTHMQRGVFSDPAESSISKASAVQTASIDIEEKQASVELQSSQKFGKVFTIETEKIVMPTNKWHELKAGVANGIEGNVIGWISLVLPADFTAQENKKILLFGPGEEKEISWQIRVDKELKKNEYLSGQYRIIALGDEAEESLKVLPGTTGLKEEADIELASLIPIIQEGLLIVNIELENIGARDATATITVEGNEQEITVPGFESKKASVSIESIENKGYAVTIKGDGIDYETTITVQEGKPLPEQPPAQIQGQYQPVTQAIDLQGIFTIETGIMAAIGIGIAAIVLLLKELLSR